MAAPLRPRLAALLWLLLPCARSYRVTNMKLESNMETKLETKLETELETKMETKREAKMETKLEAKMEAKREAKMEAKLEAKREAKREAKMEAKLEAKREAKTVSKLEAKMETEQGSPGTGLMAWLGNDNIRIDASEAENKMRDESPGVLNDKEYVEMAFKVGRNKVYFTDYRVILRPRDSWTRHKVTFQSVPYQSIKAYSIETAGYWPDMDNELVLYTVLPSLPTIQISFRKGSEDYHADIYDVGRFFAKKILGLEVPKIEKDSLMEVSSNASANGTQKWFGDAIAWLGGDASQISETQVEEDLRKNVALLGKDERVRMAFKVGRDTTLLTTNRLVKIDVQGITGTSINFMTIPYAAIKAFALQTAGLGDFDAEMTVWTELPGLTQFEQDLRAGKADVKGIQRLLSDHVLGVSSHEGWYEDSLAEIGPLMDIYHWLGENHEQVDPRYAEEYIRSHRVLQARSEEQVLMAFSVGRDMNLLTNKRLLMIDVKMFGKKVEYKTIPYHAIHAYAVQTAGYFDGDAEVMIWTKISPPPPIAPDPEDNLPPPPVCPTVPGHTDCLSYITFDLARGRADVLGIQELLSAYVMGLPRPSAWGFSSWLQAGTGAQNPLMDLYHYMDDNAAQFDPEHATRMFQAGRILLEGETVLLAFHLGGDYHLWTSKRFLLIDRHGWFDQGRSVLYRSIPYHAIRGFEVTSAGSWDWDAELGFWTDMPWLHTYRQDLRSGQVNLAEILGVLREKVQGHASPLPHPAALVERRGPLYDTIGWWYGYAYEVDADEADTEFRSGNNPILGSDERVLFACKISRDTIMLTNKRALKVDVQGFTGSRVNYQSIPYGSVGSFFIRTAGYQLNSEMQLFTDAPAMPHLQQDFRYELVDLWKVSEILTEAVYYALMRKHRRG